MLKNYDELDKNEKNTTHQANLIEIGMNTKLPSKLIYFIVGEENLIVKQKAKKRLKDESEQQNMKNQIIRNLIYTKIEIPKENYYKSRITRFFYVLVQMPVFGTVILFCILLNTIFLSLERYPMPESEKNAYENVNYFFSSIFAVEVVLKIIGLSPRKFIMDKFNIFDSIIVLVSLLELFLSSGSGGVSALRAFRLFRIFKLFRTGNLRVLLDSIAYTMGTIGNYAILLGLFIYVYSLLGMQFFAGKLTFDSEGFYDANGEVSRANFDTIYWAAITVFEVLIGDNWNDVMFDCIKSVGLLSTIYFISLILFGSIIMLNLFLAILLGNFDKARTFWLKKTIFEMFETAITKNYSLNKAIFIILGDMDKSVKKELLIHEPKDILRINGRLMIINRKILENDPEAQDKLNYYDKIAMYETDYKPIVEDEEYSFGDEDEDQEFEYASSKLKTKKSKPQNILQKIIEEHDEFKSENENFSNGKDLNESKDGLVGKNKRSTTLKEDILEPKSFGLQAQDGKLFEKTPRRGIQRQKTFKMEHNEKFVSVNTPREKVDDLEDVQVKTRRPLFIKKRITKSVTFDFNKSESKEPDIDEFDSDSKSSDSEDKKDLDDAH